MRTLVSSARTAPTGISRTLTTRRPGGVRREEEIGRRRGRLGIRRSEETASPCRRATPSRAIRTVAAMTGEQHPDEGLGTIALGLGIAGLLPIPGVVAAIAAIVCGRRALATDTSSTRHAAGCGSGSSGSPSRSSSSRSTASCSATRSRSIGTADRARRAGDRSGRRRLVGRPGPAGKLDADPRPWLVVDQLPAVAAAGRIRPPAGHRQERSRTTHRSRCRSSTGSRSPRHDGQPLTGRSGPVAMRDGGGFPSVGCVQLAQDVGDVDAGGLHADHQLVGDLAIGEPVGEEGQHLDLTGGEPKDLRRVSAPPSRPGSGGVSSSRARSARSSTSRCRGLAPIRTAVA